MAATGLEQKSLTPPKGWVTAMPLENYSSLHELSLLPLLGVNIPWPRKRFFLQFNFNLHTPLTMHPQAFLIFDTRDVSAIPAEGASSSVLQESLAAHRLTRCYSIADLKRWRLDIAAYRSMHDYLDATVRWHRCNHAKSSKIFSQYGCEISFIEGDWTAHAERVYYLYANVAGRHGDWLYDLNFFKEAAKRPDYHLICAWYGGEMVGVFVLQEELPTLHSICCGFDYVHSSASYAYSWMHYALIEHAIASQKYQNIDVGLTADESKKSIGFEAVPTRMDIYCTNPLISSLLRRCARFTSATITPAAKLKVSLKRK